MYVYSVTLMILPCFLNKVYRIVSYRDAANTMAAVSSSDSSSLPKSASPLWSKIVYIVKLHQQNFGQFYEVFSPLRIA